jgi:large subunit ribosomal protein L18e
MKRTGPTNIVLRKTIRELYKLSRQNKAPIWRAVAEELEKPRRQRRVVNVSRINRYTSDGDIVVVPGKVLGAGTIDHPVIVAAAAFSKTAVEKIKAAGGEAIHILELARRNPRGSNVKIIG